MLSSIQIMNQSPMGRKQMTVVILGVALFALDGFDVLAIAFAAPGIAQEWDINRAVLGVVLSMELIGMAIGSMVFGSLADSKGRKPTILICLIIICIGMFFAGTAQSVNALSIHRFYTGLGIGGILAATNAITAEFSNAKHRDFCILLMAGGFPIGVIIGGSFASYLLQYYTWHSIFIFGAIVTLAFIPLVYFLLTESPIFLSNRAAKGDLGKVNIILKTLGKPQVTSLPQPLSKPKVKLAHLFSPQLIRTTSMLTLAYFMHIMTLYFVLKWIPKIIADMGFSTSLAGSVLVWANVGMLVGSALIALLSKRIQLNKLMVITFICSAVAVAIFGMGFRTISQLSIIAAVAGIFINAGVVGLYSLFATMYPADVSASGTGFSIGVGRGGAALSPIVAGILFVAGYELWHIALLMSVGSLIAAVAFLFLGKKDRRKAI